MCEGGRELCDAGAGVRRLGAAADGGDRRLLGLAVVVVVVRCSAFCRRTAWGPTINPLSLSAAQAGRSSTVPQRASGTSKAVVHRALALWRGGDC